MQDCQKALGVKCIRTIPKRRKKFQFLSTQYAVEALRFHNTIKGYKPTPLISLDCLALELGVGKIFVKDESQRFDLNAFKVLGGAYAIAKIICNKIKIDINEVTFDLLRSAKIKEQLGNITFVTATDGNHGRGIAWSATQLGYRSVIYLPQGSAQSRVEAIRKAGGDAIVTDCNYDDTVRLAISTAEEKGWYIVQDTAWEGYTEVSDWIMQGYTAMVYEALEQMQDYGINKPSHVFLQAGVGSMAGAVTGFLADKFPIKCPSLTIIEPKRADCFYQSALMHDGKPHNTQGDLKTIMAGLACGEPNPIAWDIINEYADWYFTCPDFIAAEGMRILAKPFGNDQKITSGESGAVGVGLLWALTTYEEMLAMKKSMGLNKDSVLLFFSTEGNTEPVNYEAIVKEGRFPSPVVKN